MSSTAPPSVRSAFPVAMTLAVYTIDAGWLPWKRRTDSVSAHELAVSGTEAP